MRERKSWFQEQHPGEQNTLELRTLVESYDHALELYLPVLMTYCKYYWDKRDYQTVERMFR